MESRNLTKSKSLTELGSLNAFNSPEENSNRKSADDPLKTILSSSPPARNLEQRLRTSSLIARPKNAWNSLTALPIDNEYKVPPLSSIPIALTEVLKTSVQPKEVEILVVGTEKFTSALCAHFLMQLDYQVTWIENGAQAIDILQNESKRFQIIFYYLLDLEMHGFEFLVKLQELDIYPEKPPIIILSSGGGIDTATKALRLGALDFLSSPLTIELLKSRIQFFLEYTSVKQKIATYIKETLPTVIKSSEAKISAPEQKLVEVIRENEVLKKELDQLKEQIRLHQNNAVNHRVEKAQELKKQVSEAFATPLTIVTKMVRDLSKSKSVDLNELKKSLLLIMNSLSSSDLFSPRLEKLMTTAISDKWSAKEQEVAKRWIVAQFTKKTLHPRQRRSMSLSSIKHERPKSDFNTELMQDIMKRIPIVASWDFFVWAYSDEELFLMLAAMFKDLGILDMFSIPMKKFFSLSKAIRSRYKGNSYHNFEHAFDVTNMVYLMLKHTQACEYLTKLDQFALMLSALCHDIDHPGLNNSFQVAARTDLALLYNDISVLENHHAATTWKILSNPENNILINLSADEEKELRKIVTASILATDMAIHFELMTKLSLKVDSNTKFERDNKEDRQLLCNLILHSADISNLCRPYEISKKWSDGLLEEMLLQGDLEKNKGLAVSPYMDREDSDQQKLTLNFAKFIVLPLYKKLHKLLPKIDPPCIENLLNNIHKWEESKNVPARNPQLNIVDINMEGAKPLPKILKKTI